MPARNRRSEDALEAQLRAARPAPTAEVTQAITDRVRTRQADGTRRFGRLHLALAGGLTALVLTPVVATGFGGIGSFGKATKSTKASAKSSAAYMTKARSGRAHGVLSGNRTRALARLARVGSAPATAGLAPTAGTSLASFDDAGAFFGDVFRAQNDLEATQDVYGQECDIDALIQENNATLTQGGNTATGGNATATGGAGGDASTGNTQTNTGNTTATGDNVLAFGGDTEAESGDATGGAGGSATAVGGNATATNTASQTLINVACVGDDD
jgi:hypothetical protein